MKYLKLLMILFVYLLPATAQVDWPHTSILPIYPDSTGKLYSPWINASWNDTVSFTDTSIYKYYTIRNNTAPWGAFVLQSGNWGAQKPLDSTTTQVSMEIVGPVKSPIHINFSLNSVAVGTALMDTITTTWKVHNIIPQSLGVTKWDAITIENYTGSACTFYVTNISTSNSKYVACKDTNKAFYVFINQFVSPHFVQGYQNLLQQSVVSDKGIWSIWMSVDQTTQSLEIIPPQKNFQYPWNLNANNIAPGAHILKFGAMDTCLNVAWSDSATIYVRTPEFTPYPAVHTGLSKNIYTDSIVSGRWGDTSTAQVVYQYPTRVYAGKYAISVLADSGEYLQIHLIDTIPMNGNAHLEFRLYTDSLNTQMYVCMNGTYMYVPVDITDIPKSYWTYVQIPLESFGYTKDQCIRDLRIAFRNKTTQHVYIDNLRITK